MPENKIRTTVTIDKNLFLKFKALCALRELGISDEIEELIKYRVEELEKTK